jgi:hypothetical protein
LEARREPDREDGGEDADRKHREAEVHKSRNQRKRALRAGLLDQPTNRALSTADAKAIPAPDSDHARLGDGCGVDLENR